MVKPRSKQAAQQKANIDDTAIEALAKKLADKPYGETVQEDSSNKNESVDEQGMERITISLPQNMRYLLEDTAMERKRAKEPSRSVSAITRDALEDYFKKIGKA